ncbi:MAG: TetR family transcriptional regulator [Rhodospirillaceae bacterium]
MRRTKENAEQTRCAILDAAERLFSEKGIAATSLEKISRAAGVTRGAFYWHFKDKSDLLIALCARRVLPQQELLSLAAEQGHADPLGLLEEAGRDVLEIFEADEGQQRLFRILSNHGADSEVADQVNEHNRKLFEMLRGVADLAQQNGTLNPDFTPEEAAVLLLVSMNGVLSEWLRSSKAFSLTTLGSKVLSAQTSTLRKTKTQNIRQLRNEKTESLP